MTALEELASAGIVRELGGSRATYDFSHARLRALVYEEIGLARRRLLHRRVADLLSTRGRPDPDAALAAHHYRLAGGDEQAAEHYRLAARHAASLRAHADALAHLEAALGLGHPEQAELQEERGDLQTLLGDYAGALSSYELAAAGHDADRLSSLEHKIGGVHVRRGEWDRAEARYGAALASISGRETALRARVQADRSLIAYRAGRVPEATALAEEARDLAWEADDRRAQAQAHNALGILLRSDGRLPEARHELGRSLELAEELDDPEARIAALNNLALAMHEASELEPALTLTERALALCDSAGDRHREAAIHNNLADLHHAAGHAEESMAHLKRAVAIFAEVGADDAARLPEIWKLVSW